MLRPAGVTVVLGVGAASRSCGNTVLIGDVNSLTRSLAGIYYWWCSKNVRGFGRSIQVF